MKPHSPYTIRTAKTDEAHAVARLLRRAVPPQIRPLTILGQEGIAEWIEAAIRHFHAPQSDAPSQPNTNFLVATTGNTVCGVSEWRIDDRKLFLNGISVHPNHRQRGVGRTLLRNGLSQHSTQPYVALDVFSNNDLARNWYERLGFRRTSTRRWIVFPLDAGIETRNNAFLDGIAASPDVEICNLSTAEAHQTRFGFSTLHFEIKNSSSRHSVGRLGEDYFRITDATTFQNAAVRRTLLRLDASRTLLYLPSASSSAPAPLRTAEKQACKAKSVRLKAPTRRIDASLSASDRPT